MRKQLAHMLQGFQSTLPRGSDDGVFGYQERYAISIHAPSRERP